MVDHPDQVALLGRSPFPNPPLLFIKIDMGGHRAGAVPGTQACDDLVLRAVDAHAAGRAVLHGFYSHAGHSYAARSRDDAFAYLTREFAALEAVAARLRSLRGGGGEAPPLTLSVGASPTIRSMLNREARELGLGGALVSPGVALEVHAGVYPVLDLQQLATSAAGAAGDGPGRLALTVLAEVTSLYPGRGAGGSTEALATAGSLALGREPLSAPAGEYAAWGWVAPWKVASAAPGAAFPAGDGQGSWQVGRISQEHGILVWKGKAGQEAPLAVGQRIRIWPNHACIAGAGFDRYYVVRGDEVVDEWGRFNGW
jgi:D-serine ammonia-lyase